MSPYLSRFCGVVLLLCACGETPSTPKATQPMPGAAGNGGAGPGLPPSGGQAPLMGGTGGASGAGAAGADATAGAGGTSAAAGMGGGAGASAGTGGGAGNSYTENPGVEGNGDFVVGPDYPLDRDLTDRGNPKGRLFEFEMPIASSKIFDGKDATLTLGTYVRELRRIRVYVPAAYKDGTKAPLLIVMDGQGTGTNPCFNIGCKMDLVNYALDNLTISTDPMRKLPAFIAISVQNGGGNGKGSERGLEYDTVSDRFARFIQDEVLPAVLSNAKVKAAYPNIAFTENPWGRGAIGCSSGASAGFIMGWFRPDLFRRIVSYSGSFANLQDDDAPEKTKYPFGAWEFALGQKLIENTDAKPLRVFVQVAENDQQLGPQQDWIESNRALAAALKAKGYAYRYVFTKNAGHCSDKIFDLTIADTLAWMWRGYHAD